MKKVILHIGHDKTATTSIQKTLEYNSRILDNFGYYYPIFENRINHNKFSNLLFKEDLDENENLLTVHKLNLSNIEETRSKTQKLLSEALTKSNAHTFIFSSEVMANLNVSELETIKTFFRKTLGEVEFEIYAYARDPVAYASSIYQQRARLFPSDPKESYFHYEEEIGGYIKAFGKENVNLYKFEDACKNTKGPVGFLLDKIGFKDDVIDQMQIIKRNESISNMAVDILIYINREIPFTRYNLKKGLRQREDCKFLRSLPGRNFQLSGEYIANLEEIIRSNRIWLKDNFNIRYPSNHEIPEETGLEYSDIYMEKIVEALQGSIPIIRKLIYGYVKLRKSEAHLDVRSQRNLRIIESHIKQKYIMSTKLSYTTLAYRQRIIWFFYNLLRQSRTLRWLKHQWIDKQDFIS